MVVAVRPVGDVRPPLVVAPANTRLAKTSDGTGTATMTGTAAAIGTAPAAPITGKPTIPCICTCCGCANTSSRDRERDSKDERDDRDRRENGVNGDERKRTYSGVCQEISC